MKKLSTPAHKADDNQPETVTKERSDYVSPTQALMIAIDSLNERIDFLETRLRITERKVNEVNNQIKG